MIRTLIVEDEKLTRESLHYLITQYCPQLEVCGAASGFAEAYTLYEQQKPELLFLDIQLHSPEGTGLDFAMMPELARCGIIFISGYKDFAVEAFRIPAIDYLLKPIKVSQLAEAVQKAVVYLAQLKTAQPGRTQNSKQMLQVPAANGVTLVNKKDIIRLEAAGAYTQIVISNKNEQLIFSVNLGQLETKLGSDFLRVHKSHIINRNYISGYSRNEGLLIRMADKAEVPVSRAMRTAFFEWIER